MLGPEYSFDTQGGTRHITQSVSTRYRATNGKKYQLGSDINNIIGLSRDRVEGCDIATDDYRWSITMKQCKVTWLYERNCARLTGTVNSKKFFGLPPGEVLFLGASGRKTEGDGWVVTWSFQCRENENGRDTTTITGDEKVLFLVPSGDLAVPKKQGHDYVWFSYYDGLVTDEDGETFTIQKPQKAYVEQVYRYDSSKTKVVIENGEYVDSLEGLDLGYLTAAI